MNEINFEIDIELFIIEIKKYPEIWNIAVEEYHSRMKKRRAWINVCRVFCEEFEKKNDNDKNEIRNRMIKKWRNIKDSYMKSVKKTNKPGLSNFSGKKYIYANQLSFLQSTAVTTDDLLSLSDDDEYENREDIEKNNLLAIEKSPRYSQHKRKKRKHDVESTLIGFMKTVTTTASAIPKANPDRSFFESTLPSISSFTEDQKLEFRSEVLNIIKRMRRTQMNS